MLKPFKFIFKGNILFGINSHKKLNKIILNNESNFVCIVIDHALINLPIFKELINSIECKTKIIKCDISEPTYEKLEEKRVEIKDLDIDIFVGIGGGSALDMAKGLSVLNSNDGQAISYRGFDKFKMPISPIIAIPTTAGTGSEITPNASFIDSFQKRKLGINGEGIRPKFAILDPILTISCPKLPTISAGIDSLVHAVEAFVAINSNPIAKMFAREGFNAVIFNITNLVEDLDNIVLREKVMYGAFLSAVALMNSGTGPAAAMSYPLGVHFGVPHGIGGGIFLPHVIKNNIELGFDGYGQILEGSLKGNLKILSNEFYNLIKNTWEKLDVPQDLNIYGMHNSFINNFVNDTIELKNALDQNPLPFGQKEIKKVLENLKIREKINARLRVIR